MELLIAAVTLNLDLRGLAFAPIFAGWLFKEATRGSQATRRPGDRLNEVALTERVNKIYDSQDLMANFEPSLLYDLPSPFCRLLKILRCRSSVCLTNKGCVRETTSFREF